MIVDDDCKLVVRNGEITLRSHVHIAVDCRLFAGDATIFVGDCSGMSSGCVIYPGVTVRAQSIFFPFCELRSNYDGKSIYKPDEENCPFFIKGANSGHVVKLWEYFSDTDEDGGAKYLSGLCPTTRIMINL